VRDGERIGTVYLHASLTDLDKQLLHNVGTVAVIILVARGVVVFCSSLRQRTVLEPIFRLAKPAQRISRDRDYSIRVQKDENPSVAMHGGHTGGNSSSSYR
jgi:hypothetical protein